MFRGLTPGAHPRGSGSNYPGPLTNQPTKHTRNPIPEGSKPTRPARRTRERRHQSRLSHVFEPGLGPMDNPFIPRSLPSSRQHFRTQQNRERPLEHLQATSQQEDKYGVTRSARPSPHHQICRTPADPRAPRLQRRERPSSPEDRPALPRSAVGSTEHLQDPKVTRPRLSL